MTSYKTTPLFGGALVCDLPSNFADVSQLRQVPDHQEVFIDKDGFTSIIVEINERVGGPGSSNEIDGEAIVTHLREILAEDDEPRIWNSAKTQFTRLDQDIPALTLIATVTPPEKSRSSKSKDQQQQPSSSSSSAAAGAPPAPDLTAIVLTLVRLERESTDLLITINVPHIKGEYDESDVDLELGRRGRLIGDAIEYASRVWETFKIKDWGLFKEI
ncbi:Mog1p/PsbP-like protein [Xylariaceae sp. FL0804]|nr:Mog1p/PsbP-like protein [Xylariaceae sp. FL0804]